MKPLRYLFKRAGILSIPILLLSLLVSVIPQQVFAANYSELGVDQRARSYAYYRAMVVACAPNLRNEIKASADSNGLNTNPANGYWYGEGSATAPDRKGGFSGDATYDGTVSPYSGNSSGLRGCSFITNTALSDYWGVDTQSDMLKALNYTWNGIDAWEYQGDRNGKNKAAMLRDFLVTKGVNMEYTPPDAYFLNYNKFMVTCSPSLLGEYSSLSDTIKNRIDTYNDQFSTYEDVVYAKIKMPSANGTVDYGYTFGPGPGERWEGQYQLYEGNYKTCEQMAANVSNNAVAYSDAKMTVSCQSKGYTGTRVSACVSGVKNNTVGNYCENAYTAAAEREACQVGKGVVVEGVPSLEPVNPGSTDDDKTSCVIDLTGWIVCGIAQTIARAMDGIYGLLESMMKVQPISTDFNDPNNALYNVWSQMRNIANVGFVISFLIIVFSQLTNVGVTNYGVKKLLPRLVLAAILVNVSYFIAAIGVDLSNITGKGVYDILVSVSGDVNAKIAFGWEGLIGALLGGGVLTGVAAGALVATYAAAPTAILWLALPLLLGAVLAVFVAVFILAARQALIVILVVLSPLAFVAFLLPNTEKFFTLWRKSFTTMLIFFPIFAIIFGGSQVAGMLIIGTAGTGGDQALLILLGMFTMVAPLIITPLLVRFSGGVIGQLAGMVNNKNKGLLDRTRKFSQGKADLAAKRSLRQPDKLNRFGKPTLLSHGRRLARRLDAGKRNDQTMGKAYDNEAESIWANSAGGIHSLDALAKTGVQSEIDNNTAATRQKATLPVDLTLKARVTKMELDAAQSKEDQLVREMSTHVSNPQLDALNPSLRAEAQNAVREKSVSDSAGALAQGIQTQEYAEAIERNAGLAQRAGGIDTHGASRAVANAMNIQTKASNDIIAAEKTTMRDMLGPQLGREASNKSNSTERRLAASSMKNSVSNPKDMITTIDSLSAQLTAAISGGNVTEERVVREMQQQFMEDVGGKLPMSISGQTKGELAAGTFNRSSADDIIKAFNQGGYSGEKFANMSHHELDVVKDTLIRNKASLDPVRMGDIKTSINDFITAAVSLGKSPAGNIADPMDKIYKL